MNMDIGVTHPKKRGQPASSYHGVFFFSAFLGLLRIFFGKVPGAVCLFTEGTMRGSPPPGGRTALSSDATHTKQQMDLFPL